MTWVRIDDQFQDHPKFLGVSLAGIGLWAAGLAYCSRYLTDGHVTDKAVRRLGGTKKLTDELVRAGLWEPSAGGWDFHDYLVHQSSADKIREIREKRAEAGKRGGVARGSQKQTEAKSKQIAKPNLSKSGTSVKPQSQSPESESRGYEVTEVTGSSRPSPAGDDDDQFASDALTAFGHRRHDRAVAAGRVNGNATEHERGCVANALAEHGDRARAWRAEHPDGTTDQLIAYIDPSLAPDAEALPVEIPPCSGCGLRHTGPCFVAELERAKETP